MAMIPADWRMVDGVATAWFDAPSLVAGAALAGRLTELSTAIVLDLRATGVRVRLDSDAHADTVSAAARELGLAADPDRLQRLGVVLESTEPAGVTGFWQDVLDYRPAADGGLTDPGRRDPDLRIRRSSAPRPLRHRLHLDVVRPAAAVARVDVGGPSGPYGVCHADADGNEVDLVPGDPLGEGEATSDWQVVFGAMVAYRVDSPTQWRDLAVAAAALADDVGFPLMIDLRPGRVVFDTGKDRWDPDAHGLDVEFAELAARLQAAARGLGAPADPAVPRFVQLFFDAADVAAVRAFWVAALGYVPDRRTGLTDIIDPRGLDPVLAFQQIDTTETDRRRQRNRLHVELAVPADRAQVRLAAAVEAGGRLIGETDGGLVVADPEGNELVIISVR